MPPTFTKTLKRVDGNFGHHVSMNCKVSGSQPMTVTWFKDDQEIETGAKFQPEMKDSSITLTIIHLEKADSGVYKCKASNPAGCKETSAILYVKGLDNLASAGLLFVTGASHIPCLDEKDMIFLFMVSRAPAVYCGT